jgi:hypothetical protein
VSQALLGAATTMLALWPGMMLWVNWSPRDGWARPTDWMKPLVYAALLGGYTLISRVVTGEGGDRPVTLQDVMTAAMAAALVAVIVVLALGLGRMAWDWLKDGQR